MATPQPHLLSIKVLRANQPSLISNPLLPPSSTPSLSAPPNILEDNPLQGILLLPSSFGTIYLGETFTALLCLANTTSSAALTPSLNVSIHILSPTSASAPSKFPLSTVSREVLQGGESIEETVKYDIRERVGGYAVVCEVRYGENARDEYGVERVVERSFRKVYKFQVVNPLSVRTKSYSPPSLLALSSPSTSTEETVETQTTRVFLEVQVLNTSIHGLVFRKMKFDPVPGWTLRDCPADGGVGADGSGIFSGAEAVLPAGSIRQHLFILSPSPTGSAPALPFPPGTTEPLGRLDIKWTTPHGELGSLQTSLLGRRVPFPLASLLADEVDDQAPLPISKDPSSQESTPPIPPPISPSSLTFAIQILSITPLKLTLLQPFIVKFALLITSSAPSSDPLKVSIQYVDWSSPAHPLLSSGFPSPRVTKRLFESTHPSDRPSAQVRKVGSSTLCLPPLSLSPAGTAEHQFELKFLPIEIGLWKLGGMRVLLHDQDGQGIKVVWEMGKLCEILV